MAKYKVTIAVTQDTLLGKFGGDHAERTFTVDSVLGAEGIADDVAEKIRKAKVEQRRQSGEETYR